MSPPPVERCWTVGQRRRAGWARETAGSGLVSGTVRTCQNTCWEHDGGRYHRPDAGCGRPQARSRTRPDDRPTLRAVGTFDVSSNAAVNSDLSCSLYRGRLKQPYLHCRADAVA